MDPLRQGSQPPQVGIGTQLLNNAVAATKFLANIPEKAAGFVGRQATAVYSSLPLTQKNVEEKVLSQERKAANEAPKTSRSLTGTLESFADGAGKKVQRAYTQATELPGKIAEKIAQKQISVEKFQKKLEEVHTTQVKWSTATLTQNKNDVASVKELARQQLSFAKLSCKDPNLVQQLQKSLVLTQGIVDGTALATLQKKGKENFNQLQAMGFNLGNSPKALEQWKASHAELAEIADEATKAKLNNLVFILDKTKEALGLIENKDYQAAREILKFAEDSLNAIHNNGYHPFDNIISEDKVALSFAILIAQSKLPQGT